MVRKYLTKLWPLENRSELQWFLALSKSFSYHLLTKSTLCWTVWPFIAYSQQSGLWSKLSVLISHFWRLSGPNSFLCLWSVVTACGYLVPFIEVLFFVFYHSSHQLGLPWWVSGSEPACQFRSHNSVGLFPVLGRSPGEGNINPLQYSGLGNPMDRGAWRATFQGVTKESDVTYQLNNKSPV